jgi:ATPase subunit of ABC transporter with duplicated ATPase domains
VDGVPKSDELDWIPESNLVHKGEYVLKLRRNCDEMIKARNSGMELRPTTLAEVKSHLEDFGIAGDLAVGKIKRMSGGQKVRLVLAAAMWSMPHFLALDEPTNYLDNDTLAALTQALKQFKGGVITISHNEAFVENLCNEYWLVSDGVVTKSDSAKPKIDAAAHGPTAD